MKANNLETSLRETINIDIHADDYALSVNTSKDMLECMKRGELDSISIVPNMECYEECMTMLRGAIEELPFLPKMSVHIDLVEGHSLCPNLPNWLTSGGKKSNNDSKSNIICTSWKDLFLASYNIFSYKKIKTHLKEEIFYQINKVSSDVEDIIKLAKSHGKNVNQVGVRIDSHQHAHMLPIVWDAIMDVAIENKLNIEYIRNSREPLIPFLSCKETRKSYRLINIIKNRILFFYSLRIEKYDVIQKNNMFLWGLIMSGNMDFDRVSHLMGKIVDYSKSKGRTLEILFHPGSMLQAEKNDEIPASSFEEFYLNSGRKNELHSVMNIRSLL